MLGGFGVKDRVNRLDYLDLCPQYQSLGAFIRPNQALLLLCSRSDRPDGRIDACSGEEEAPQPPQDRGFKDVWDRARGVASNIRHRGVPGAPPMRPSTPIPVGLSTGRPKTEARWGIRGKEEAQDTYLNQKRGLIGQTIALQRNERARPIPGAAHTVGVSAPSIALLLSFLSCSPGPHAHIPTLAKTQTEN